MYYVYSTASASANYVVYHEVDSRNLSIPKHKILINGGHGIANKHFMTPKGIVTEVSDEDMEILLSIKNFNKHVKDGFITYEKKYIEPEKAAANMAQKDGSAPLTPADFEKSEYSTDKEKIYKKKGAPTL